MDALEPVFPLTSDGRAGPPRRRELRVVPHRRRVVPSPLLRVDAQVERRLWNRRRHLLPGGFGLVVSAAPVLRAGVVVDDPGVERIVGERALEELLRVREGSLKVRELSLTP